MMKAQNRPKSSRGSTSRTAPDELPKEVILCRFGSAFSTLTVMLLDAKVHREIQSELSKLDRNANLEEARLVLKERVCFKGDDGVWTRARVVGVTASGEADSVTVDLVDEDTGELYKRVTGKALVAVPPSIQHLATARLHFIEGLLPYKTIVGPKDSAGTIGAQAIADILNKDWERASKSVSLTRMSLLPMENPASKTSLQVARLQISPTVNLSSYVKDLLGEEVVADCPDKVRSLWKQARSPSSDSPSNDLCKASTLRPYVSEREICEVISLQELDDEILEVGLRLSSYMDIGLLNLMLRRRAKFPPTKFTKQGALVSINERGYFRQRGLVEADGEILGIDSLERFKGDSELRHLPCFMAEAFPHTGLFVLLKMSEQPRIPCLGDVVAVSDLAEVPGRSFYYSSSGMCFLDESYAVSYLPARTRGEKLAVSLALDKGVEERTNGKKRTNSGSVSKIKHLCGLGELKKMYFESLRIFPFPPPPEDLLEKHGEILRIEAL